MRNSIFYLFIIILFFACKEEPKIVKEDSVVEDKVLEYKPKVEVAENVTKKVKTKKQSVAKLKAELKAKGYEVFDYVDKKTKDTILMQKYFMAFLKSGPIRNQNEEEATKLQEAHRAHLRKMYDFGFADISGPFEDDDEILGITIYNVPTLKMADSLANSDPMVKAGRLVIEIHPWYAAKGFMLR